MATKPERNLAAVADKGGVPVRIEERPIPTPSDNQVLVRNRAIACNPIDWKVQRYGFIIPKLPAVLGSDVAGEVAAVGPDVTRIRPGDRVLGLGTVMMSGDADRGAWQTYTLVEEPATTRLPDALSFVDAAVLPMGLATALSTLVVGLGQPRPPAAPGAVRPGLLVWGAASSVGSCMLQLAKFAGVNTFATASPKHHDYLKSLGATACVDYRDSDAGKKLAEAAKEAGTPIALGFDTVAEPDTCTRTAQAVLDAAGPGNGTMVIAMPWPEGTPQPEGIAIGVSNVWATQSTHAELGRWLFTDWLETMLARGEIQSAPPARVVPGGVAQAQAVYDALRAGVSGQKLVVEVA